MDLNVMRYVVSVADAGNFSQAAELCHVGQPALSQQIAKLERELGISLFSRNPRGAAVTEAGAEFVRRARLILKESSELEEQMADFAGLHRGTMALGVITSLQCIEFGQLMAAFVQSYPDIAFSLHQYGSYRLLDMLRERRIDLAFLNRPLKPLPPSLEFEKLGEDYYDLAVSCDHPLASRQQVSMKELANERFIFHQPVQVASELILAACREAGFEPNIVCRSGEPNNSLYLVQGGLGIALFPREEFKDRHIDGICRLSIAEPIKKEVGMAWRKDADSPLLTTCCRFAREWCRSL